MVMLMLMLTMMVLVWMLEEDGRSQAMLMGYHWKPKSQKTP